MFNMMFKEAYKRTMGAEGGYANNPADKGKETYCGISRRFHPGWSGWNVIDDKKLIKPIRNNTIFSELSDLVEKFYFYSYWRIIGGDSITDRDLAHGMFDTAVNMGTSTAVKFLQRTLNILNNKQRYWPDLTVDGVIGPKTIKCLDTANIMSKSTLVNTTFTIIRGSKYIDILEKHEDQEVFAASWLSRLWVVSGV